MSQPFVGHWSGDVTRAANFLKKLNSSLANKSREDIFSQKD